MGQSTNGILAYGWDLGGEVDEDDWAYEFLTELTEEYEEDTDELILVKLGYDGDPENYKARAEFLKSVPFELVIHCSCDYSEYILTLKATNWSASRGYPVDVSEATKVFGGDPDYDAMLYDAAKKLGLNPPEGPKLLLASLWC